MVTQKRGTDIRDRTLTMLRAIGVAGSWSLPVAPVILPTFSQDDGKTYRLNDDRATLHTTREIA